VDTLTPDASAPLPTPPAPTPRRRLPLWAYLTLLTVAVGLLLGGLVAVGNVLYREFYSPTAFVERYLTLLSEGRAPEALAVSGVTVDSTELDAAGLPTTASQALLRRDAMAALTDVTTVSEVTDGDRTLVTVTYSAGAYPGETTFEVEREGTAGIAPTWRFAQSPLSMLNLSVRGSHTFIVNGFEIDRRQVAPDGSEADLLAPLPLLVFSPGVYSVSVDSAIAATPGVVVLADRTLTGIDVAVQSEPTEEFTALVQQRVEEFLDGCATQEILQPTGCPFGFTVQDRIVSLPQWSIVQQPTVSLVPAGDGWRIPATEALARIDVEVQSLFDGSITPVSEDVPFEVTADVVLLPDGGASITVGGSGRP
jgi:hypothetical protein